MITYKEERDRCLGKNGVRKALKKKGVIKVVDREIKERPNQKLK